MDFVIETHPVYPWWWRVVDADGRSYWKGDLLSCLDYRRTLEARMA